MRIGPPDGQNALLTTQDLEKIAGLTLEHYNRHAEDFREGTRDHDVSQNIEALLRAIEGDPPFAILDFGCGPGRDLKAFAGLGHVAVGLEGASRLAAMARADSGCEVWEQDFLNLDLPDRRFDGVFANAALFHVPSQELPRVLLQLHATLKPRGVLFASNPHGHNEEGWNRGRYGVYHDLETWRRYLSAVGIRRADSLLPPCRPAARTAALARERLAQTCVKPPLDPVPNTETWWLYVLECQGGVLYTGIAKDVDARFAAHLAGTGAIFTRLNPPLRILAKATMPTKGAALRAEYSFKQASRVEKLEWCAAGLERFIALDRR